MTRVALAAVVATVVDMVYGYVVYGLVLAGTFAGYPAIYRPADDMSHMGYLVLGVLIIMFAAAFIFVRGYEGRGALAEGLRFGCVMGTLMVGVNVVNFAVMNLGRRLTLQMAVAGFVEFVLIGVVIGLVSNPAGPARRAATV